MTVSAKTAHMHATVPFMLLSRLRVLDLPHCTDSTAFALVIVANNEGSTSTDLTRHGSTRHGMDTQLRLLTVMIYSIRLAESRCRRKIILLANARALSVLQDCHGDCREIQRFNEWTRKVAIPFSWQEAPLVHPDLPSAVKLIAFNLTNYNYIVTLDADMLVLRSMDELFEQRGSHSSQLTTAHHPYDLVQGEYCGLPLLERGVGALMGFAPNRSALVELTASLHRLCETDHKKCLRMSEQLTTACDFYTKGKLRTLGCGYLYDLATPRFEKGAGGYWQCLQFGGIGSEKERQDIGAKCRAIAAHVTRDCLWPQTHPVVRAVHFKGKIKPWNLITHRECRGREMSGRLEMVAEGNLTAYAGTDHLFWSKEVDACVSKRHGLPLRWAGGAPLTRPCCTINVAIGVEWRALRADICRSQQQVRGNVTTHAAADCIGLAKARKHRLKKKGPGLTLWRGPVGTHRFSREGGRASHHRRELQPPRSHVSTPVPASNNSQGQLIRG